MAKIDVPHLHLRGKTWYFLIAVPKHLRKKLGKNQIWKSLGTSDEAEAIERAKPLRNKYQLLFESKRPVGAVDLIETTKPKAVEKMQSDLGLPRWHHSEFATRPLLESFQQVAAFLDMLKEFTKNGSEPPAVMRAAGWGVVNNDGIRMSEALEKYVELHPHKVKDLSKEHREAKVGRWNVAVKDFIAVIGDLDIRKIEKLHATKYKAHLVGIIGVNEKGARNVPKKITLETANMRLTFLSMIVGELLDEVYDIDKNPFAKVLIEKKQGTGKKKKTVLPLDEEQMLVVNELKGNKDIRALMDITECTGAGIRELVGLLPEDIVLENTPYPHIVIRPNRLRDLKNDNRPRVLPLYGKALEAMKQFPTGFKRYQGPKGDGAVSNRVNALLTKAGIDRSWNSFRHRFDDLLRWAGVPVDQRSVLKGNSEDMNPQDAYYGSGFNMEQKYNAIKAAMEWAEKKQAEIIKERKETPNKNAA